MNAHFIDQIMKSLRGQFKDSKKAREKLAKAMAETDVVAWHTSDILQEAEQEGKLITEDDAREILHSICHRADCEIGVTWDTIHAALFDYPDLLKCHKCGSDLDDAARCIDMTCPYSTRPQGEKYTEGWP